MLEDGIVDLDADIRQYVDFPAKYWKREERKLTSRMLAAHLGGIRHYDKAEEKETETKEAVKAETEEESAKEEIVKTDEEENDSQNRKDKTADSKPPITLQQQKKKEFEMEEYFIKDHFNSVTDSISLFKDDPLIAEPGETFLYTTHGFTLLSAVMEGAAVQAAEANAVAAEASAAEGNTAVATPKEALVEEVADKAASKKSPPPTFVKLITAFFKRLGLRDTCCEENDPLVPNRARHYRRNKFHKLENVPYVDNSYKWAGGGFLSTVTDLIKFGNAALYAFQYGKIGQRTGVSLAATDEGFCDDSEDENAGATSSLSSSSPSVFQPGFASRRTMQTLWTPAPKSVNPWAKDEPGNGYGVGWGIVPSADVVGGVNLNQTSTRTPMYVSHTGGAVGASSVLLIVPGDRGGEEKVENPFEGVVVAMISNLQEVGLYKTAVKIADLFVED